MAVLLIVAHAPAGSMTAMLDAVTAGSAAEGIVDVHTHVVPALEAKASDVLGADAIIVGTPANFGYMSGALKHFFDTIYPPCVDHSSGRPFASFVHGESDTSGALAAIDKITTGLRWVRVQPDVSVIGSVDRAAVDQCWELGAAVAAGISG